MATREEALRKLDFGQFQQALDACFHGPADPVPAGSAEHAELLTFVQKIHAMKAAAAAKAQQQGAGGASAGGAAAQHGDDAQLREQLGIPTTWDARFRINVSIVCDKGRLRQAAKAIDAQLQRAAGGGPSSSSRGGPPPRHGRDDGGRDRSGRDRDRDRDQRDRARDPPRGGDSEQPLTGTDVVEAYRACLPWWHDFHQRRQLARLKKLVSDKAALPMAAFEGAIVSAVRAHQAVVIAGDTGCGKSTQVPQFLINAGFKRVVCTQPRRISAISLCRRVAYETLNVYGNDVAYKIRFASTASGGSRIIFMTEGILLRMMASDPMLSSYDVVVIDEVHERHLNTDFLLALLRALLLQRPELRLVLMSATINFQAYSAYFGNAPVIQVPGRLYPIDLEYVPPNPEQAGGAAGPSGGARGADPPPAARGAGGQGGGARGGRGGGKGGAGGKQQQQDAIDPAPYLRLLQRIDSEYPQSQRGDLLVFVAGLADITALCDALRLYAAETRRWVVLPLHSSLAVEAQDKVFDAAPEGVRKVIVSTNIAETSITIDGVRFVADSGRAKEMVVDTASGAGSLQEGWISRASADQRKGRAGRTGPGKCFRMYTAQQYDEFRPYSLPEIQRVRLESVVLQIKSLAGDALNPRAFGFIDPPPEDGLEAAIINLRQVGALTADECLTPLGCVLSMLPVEPAIGKLLVLGGVMGLLDPALTLAAALSVQSPFSRLADDNESARAARYELMDRSGGDALTLIGVFETWLRVRQQEGRNAATKWCRRAGLEEQRLHEMAKLKAQFQELLTDVGLHRLAVRGEGELAGGQRRKRHHLGAAGLHAARQRLRELQHQRDRERGRKVLRVEEEPEGGRRSRREQQQGEGSEEEGGQGQEGGEEGSSTEGDEEDEEAQELRDLDLRVAADVAAMAATAMRPMTKHDKMLIKWMLAVSLYPRLAVPDEMNRQRREPDCRFHTAVLSDLVVHPSSCLTGTLPDISTQEVLVYTELLETRRQYLCNLTPCWALAPLLLGASHVDADAGASRFVVDGWLLLRLHDGSGEALLSLVARLRQQVALLLHRRLSRARLPNAPSARFASGAGAQLITAPAAPRGSARAWQALPWDLLPPGAGASVARLTAAARAAGVPADLLDALGYATVDQPPPELLAGGPPPDSHEQAPGGGDGYLDAEQPLQPGAQQEQEGGRADDGGATPAQVWVPVLPEDELAASLALAMEWPSRFTVERLLPGARTTALYHLPPSGAPAGGDGAAAAMPAQEVLLDVHGAPRHKQGVRLAPWLQWGALRGFDSALAAHALQPALRKHWVCPGCSTKLIATYEEVQAHLASCAKASGLPPEVLEVQGYGAAPSAAGATEGAAQDGDGVAGSSEAAGALQADGVMRFLRHAQDVGAVRWSRRVPALSRPEQPQQEAWREEEQQRTHPPGQAGWGDSRGQRVADDYGPASHRQGQDDSVERGGAAMSAQADGRGGRELEDGASGVKRLFDCGNCGLSARLTPVEILMHKRTCARKD